MEDNKVFSWSKWSKDNIAKEPHRFQIGDMVITLRVEEVIGLHQDCDGSSLYELDQSGHGHSDEVILRPASNEESFLDAKSLLEILLKQYIGDSKGE